MKAQAINLKDKLGAFNDHWSPRVIAEMDDYQFKLVKLVGDFVWHEHPDTDEVFLVVSGAMQIEFRDRIVTLRAGELCVVPKGVEHIARAGELCVVPKGVEHIARAAEECHALIVEPRGVVNTGVAGGALTARNDVWI